MTERESDRFRLHVLGTPDLRAPDGRRLSSILSQPKRLSLLTHLALSPAPVSRASLVALFWPESDEARARNALSQAVHHLRRTLGDDVVQGSEGDRLWTSQERLWCDARVLLVETEPGEALLRAAERDLLEGWNADDSQPLQEWLDAQRRRIRARTAGLAEMSAANPMRVAAPDLEPPVLRGDAVVKSFQRASGAPTSLHASNSEGVGRVAAGMIAAGVIVVLGVAVGIALAATRPPETRVEQMAVLMPRVVAAPGVAEMSPQAVLDEVLAHLPKHALLRVVPTPSATSLPDLRRQLSAIGTRERDLPEWVLEVSIRVTSSEARAVGLLQHTPSSEALGREGFGVPYAGEESDLIDVPQHIAVRLADMVERVLAADAATSR